MKLHPNIFNWQYIGKHQEILVACYLQVLLFLIWLLRNITVDVQQYIAPTLGNSCN